MRSMSIPAAAILLLTFCSPGRDHQSRETGMAGAAGDLNRADTLTPGSGDSAAAEAGTPRPAAILSQLNVADTREIQVAGLAARRATSAAVKQVARRLVADHTKNREQVQALAQTLNLDLTAQRGGAITGADTTVFLSELLDKSGPEFDKAFVQHEIEDHQANVERIKTQLLPAAQNDQVKTYLEKTITDMEAHLAALKRAQQQIGA